MKAWMNNLSSLVITDLKEFFRVRLIITSSALMPVIMTLAYGLGMKGNGDSIEGMPYFDFIFPGILALGTMFSAVFCGGYIIILDRQKSLIRDLLLSPVSYSTYILARLFAAVIKSSAQFVFCLIVAIPFIERGFVVHPFMLLTAFFLTALLFAAVGMILGSFSNVLTFPGIANFVLLPSMFFGGVFFPLSNFKTLGVAIQLIPFTGSVGILRYSITGTNLWGSMGLNFFMLLFYTFGAIAFWIWFFKKRIRRGL